MLDGDGSPGSDYVRTVNRRKLAGSSGALFNRIRYRSAGLTGRSPGVSATTVDALAVPGHLASG